MTLALLCCLACCVTAQFVTDVQPSSGKAGDTVTVSGTDFCGGALTVFAPADAPPQLPAGFKVYFGPDHPATNYGTPTCGTPNTVTVTVPAGTGIVAVSALSPLTVVDVPPDLTVTKRSAEHTHEKRDAPFEYIADGTE
jgi:hypothetical protein